MGKAHAVSFCLKVLTGVAMLALFGCGGGTASAHYTVTGTLSNGTTPLAGVTVTLTSSGTVVSTGITDSNGTYRLQASNGSYMVAPADRTWGFTPFAVTVNGADTTARATSTVFTVYTITGKVTKDGAPLPGISVSLNAALVDIYHIDGLYGGTVVDLTTVTDGTRVNPVTTMTLNDGSYTFVGNNPGCYLVSPSNADYNFKPIKTAAFTITNTLVYLYNPELTGNQLTTDGKIIYNGTMQYSGNNVSIQDFTAEVKNPVIIK